MYAGTRTKQPASHQKAWCNNENVPRVSRGFNPAFATAAQSAQAIREKTTSATELLAFTYGRIDHHNQKINAIVWQCREKAMASARQVDEILAKGKPLGPLHGVPVTIKEAFAYQGSPNTWGLLSLKDVISPRTAVAAERLESAGAIVMGKTNVCVMLGDWQTYNPVYGTTNNPWDFTLTAGGSTGGGAAGANVTKWAEREDALFLPLYPTACYAVGYEYGHFS